MLKLKVITNNISKSLRNKQKAYVNLTSSSDYTWKVELTKIYAMLFLKDGWK